MNFDWLTKYFKKTEPTLIEPTKEAQFILKTDGIIHQDGRIKIQMDWNQEFINNARASGCGGVHDQEIVEQMLSTMLCSILGITR
jgi:hypothetical protein